MEKVLSIERMTEIKHAWTPIIEDFNSSGPLKRLGSGNISIEHYKSVLRQIFHYSREDPQIQALTTIYFRGKQRQLIRKFYQHAISEIGHDQLALNDLRSLGEDVSQIPFERPLPATIALIAYPIYQIQFHNPVGYLGYLFFLEFMPTGNGRKYMTMLENLGVPESAMTFIRDHATIDVGHNKLMEVYVNELVVTEEDLESVIYAMRVTAKLYADMIESAFEHADNPKSWGMSRQEMARA
jgi:hypothetical protein